MWLDEAQRWLASPSRRLLLLAYLGLALSLAGLLWALIYPFLYQRLLASVIVRDLDYAYQITGFIGRGRALGYAVFRSPRQARFRMIVLGRVVLDLPLPVRKTDVRRLRARMLLLAREGAPTSARLGALMGRLHERAEVDKFFVRAGVGLGDPALTGMAAAALYPLSVELPKESQRYVVILPMFERDGIDLEAELGVGFRLYNVWWPTVRFLFHPTVVKFTWRWRFPRVPKQSVQRAADQASQKKEQDHGREVLRDRVAA